MKKQNKIKTIVDAKLKDTTPKEDWQKKRLEACGSCKFNSDNKDDLSVTDLAKVALNGGKSTCLACGCGLQDKTHSKTEACGLEGQPELGEMKWNRIEILTSTSDKVDIINNNSDNYNFDLVKKDIVYEMGYIKPKEEVSISFSLDPKEGFVIKNLDVKVGCSCTVPKIEDDNGLKIINLLYKAGSGKGTVVKRNVVKYKINNKEYTFSVLLKGRIV